MDVTNTDPWIEYAETVRMWDEMVATACAQVPADEEAVRQAYRERWSARLRHPSWDEKRSSFIWYTDGHCEHCGLSFPEADLQLHHLHYDTLWYENNRDLELLCKRCHRLADEERARSEMQARRTAWSLEARARNYMEIANRHSGQEDWPVTYEMAVRRVEQMDEEDQ